MPIENGLRPLLVQMAGTASVDEVAAAALSYGQTRYQAKTPASQLVEFEHGPATYLFDLGSQTRAERTAAVVARPTTPDGPRDADYQRGFPTRTEWHGRALDRGHFVAFSGGGLFGPNLFDQDRALNRGWSAAGKRYRALENRAVRATGAVLVVLPQYTDDSDFPAFLDMAVIDGPDVEAARFRNRYDLAPDRHELVLDVHLDGATNAQIGGLGEETAAIWIESELCGTIVALGDAEMPRAMGRQDLDVLAIVDDILVAFEVKTRFHSRYAGRTTRTGDLYRPRLRRASGLDGHRQGSQPYVARRLSDYVDTDDEDYLGVEVRVIGVDLVGFLIQQFRVDDGGRRMTPVAPPASCRNEAEAAVDRIHKHRGRF